MWISVHDNVLGGKLRKLAKEIGCSQNEALGLLVRMWIWGTGNSDKDGKLIGVDFEDMSDVLSVGLDKNYRSIDAVMALASTGWIDTVGDDIYIHDWPEWQMQLYKLNELKEQNAERQRRYRERAREKAERESEESQKSTEKPKQEKKPSGYTPSFEEFWKAYPRKVGKGEAYKKYKARLNDGYSEEELLEAATNYAARCASERTEDKYIKHAKTFLSDALPFTDYIKQKKQAQDPRANYNSSDPYSIWRD